MRTLPQTGWKVGDTVYRPINVYKSDSPIRRGIVTRRYSEPGYPELYEVTWTVEGGRPIEPLVCVGFLRHGLDNKPTRY